MITPRVFVGTMYCGEGDFDSHCKSVWKQTGIILEKVVISGLPEKEAHNKLWESWRAAKDRCEMFVKVDADTALAHPEVLLSFWKVMSSNPRITGIQAPLFDYFTDGYINGLNCFSPKVTFLDTNDKLYCDRVDVNHDIVIKSGDVPESLKPAGFHCFDASEAQSFHFGVHRALKGQTSVLKQVRQAWLRNKDRNRGLALIGASESTRFVDGGFNYGDELFQETLVGVTANYERLVERI